MGFLLLTVINAVIGAGMIALSFSGKVNPKRQQVARVGGIVLIVVAAFLPVLILLTGSP